MTMEGLGKKGFSLLEIVLALGILGMALPLFISNMTESSNDSSRRIQILLAQNMEKNLCHVLETISVVLPLTTNCTFCGYKSDCFTIDTASTGWDSAIPPCLIEKKQETAIIKDKVKRIAYDLYPYNLATQIKQETWKSTVFQWIVSATL
jgi:prepilin-type N-terminal cleavage/methylation domain-containing protein